MNVIRRDDPVESAGWRVVGSRRVGSNCHSGDDKRSLPVTSIVYPYGPLAQHYPTRYTRSLFPSTFYTFLGRIFLVAAGWLAE